MRRSRSATLAAVIAAAAGLAGVARSAVSSLWNGTLTRSGNHYTVVNASSNGVIAQGSSKAFGFNVGGTSAPVNLTAG